jgi:hypothetical protein
MTRARAAELALTTPSAAAAAAPRPARGRSARDEAFKAMGGDVKALLATGALVLLAGLGYLVFGPQPTPPPAVLGFVDAGPPKAAPKARKPQPPFKLPWWK